VAAALSARESQRRNAVCGSVFLQSHIKPAGKGTCALSWRDSWLGVHLPWFVLRNLQPLDDNRRPGGQVAAEGGAVAQRDDPVDAWVQLKRVHPG